MANGELLEVVPPGEMQNAPLLEVPVNPIEFVSPETAASTTNKLTFGAPDFKSAEDAYGMLTRGEGPALRKELATKNDFERSMRKSQMIRSMVEGYAKTGQAIPKDLFDNLQATDSLDPDVAIAKTYGATYMNKLREYRNKPPSIVAEADKENPAASEALINRGEDVVTYRQYLIEERDRMRDAVSNQATFPYILDQVKMFSQLYQEFKLRGYAGTSFFEKLGLGSTLDEHASRLMQRPFPQFKNEVRGTLNQLAKNNPSLALFYIDSLIGQSTNETFLNNVMSAAILTAIGTAARLGKIGARSATRIRQEAETVKSLVKADALNETPEVKAAEGLGDTGKSAEQLLARDIVESINKKEDPKRNAKEALHGIFQPSQQIFLDNPGPKMGREIHNRIYDQGQAWFSNTMSVIGNMMKVERLPFMEAVQNASKIIGDETIIEFRGVGLKDSFIAHNVRKDKFTNTWLEDIVIVGPDGKGFKGPDGEAVAHVYARDHGLGYSDVKPTTFGVGKLSPTGESLGSRYEVTAKGTIRSLSPTELAAEARIGKVQIKVGDKAKWDVGGGTKEITWVSPDRQFVRLGNSMTDISVDSITKVGAAKPIKSVPVRPESEKTVFLDASGAKRFTELTKTKTKGGKITDTDVKGLRIVDTGTSVRIVKQSPSGSTLIDNIPYSSEPQAGKRPLELFSPGKTEPNIYGNKVLGDEVTSVSAGHKIETKTGYTVEQLGEHWYIRVTRPLEETRDVVRDLMLVTDITKTPSTWQNQYLGFLTKYRTPEETLSSAQRSNRHVATYTPSLLLKIFQDEAKDIARLARWTFPFSSRKEAWMQWKRTVDYARDAKNPITGEKGYFYQNMAELENHYQQFAKRAPTDAEAAAYFSFTRLVEADHILRNLELYKMKARVGAKQFDFAMADELGKQVNSPVFEGVLRNKWPSTADNIFVAGTTLGQGRMIRGGVLTNQVEYDNYIKAVEEGRMHVIEVFDVESRPLKGFGKIGNERVRFVITPAYTDKPLSFNQVIQKGGSFFDTQYDFYVKQAKIIPENIQTRTKEAGKTIFKDNLVHWYEGDNTFMGILQQTMGRDVTKNLNELQRLLRENKIDEARAFATGKFPMDWDRLHGYFKDTTVNGKAVPPRFSLTEPFHVVKNGQLVADVDNIPARYKTTTKTGNIVDTFRDGTREGSLARQHQVQYTGKRDDYEVFTFKDEGTRGNPAYKYEPTEYLDPVASLQRGFSRITNSAFLDDYKIFSVESWLKEALAAGILDPQKISAEAAKRSPHWAFHQGPNNFLPGADDAMVNKMKAAHYQINQLLGIKGEHDKTLYSTIQKLADSVYGKYGPNRLTTVANWALPTVRDPVSFIRGMTFHMSLGLWNVPQLLIQANTFTNILGIAGWKFAAPGTRASLMHRWLNVNEGHLDHIDKLMSQRLPNGSYKVPPGGFKEAYMALKSSGFESVGGEFVTRDADMSHKIVQSGKATVLDSGTWFFKEGERQVRLGAWYTSFFEFRSANPTGRLTEANMKTILTRADLLTANMSRASASALNHGVLSIPAQFVNYTLRNAELFMGKRLTSVERYRLMATYAALYGAPATAGLTGLPLPDVIRKAGLEDGYVVGDNWMDTAMMDGIPSMFIGLVTGKHFNIQDRYALQGWESIRETIRGDKSMWELMGGASLSKFKEAIESQDGFWRAMLSIFRDDEDRYPLTADNMMKPFRTVSSFNNLAQLWEAVDTGRSMSKKGMYLDDVDPLNATIQFATGLKSAKASDAYLGRETLKDREDRIKETIKLFIEPFKRGMMAYKDGDVNAAVEYMKEARVLLKQRGFPPNRMSEALALASEVTRPLHAQVDWNKLMKDTDSAEFTRQLPAYQKRTQ